LNQTELNRLSGLLHSPANIVVTSHYNPDGDAVGSAMAVYHLMKQLNHQVTVIFPNSFPDFLKWIQESENALLFGNQPKESVNALEMAHFVFCLDYNSPDRTGKMEEALRKSPAMKILIDHHPNPATDFFHFVHHDTSASSTAELVYDFFSLTGLQHLINKPVAESLYTGIITDTGSLSFNCNKSSTYRIVADLIEKGTDAELLHRLIYDNFSESRMRLLGYAVFKKMEILPHLHTAIIPLTLKELGDFDFQQGDTEGIVNYPLSVKSVNFSVLLTQRSDRIRLSFRSKGDFPANEIAAKYFVGGGHRNAAGGDSFVSMEETIARLKEILPEYKEQLDFKIS